MNGKILSLFFFTWLIGSCSDTASQTWGDPIEWPTVTPSGIAPAEIVMGNRFYVDPENGDDNGDGSMEHPWQNLQFVIDNYVSTYEPAQFPADDNTPLVEKNADAPVKAYDAIMLRAGFHGPLTLERARNEGFITISAVEGEEAVVSRIHIIGSSYWNISNITVSREYTSDFEGNDLVDITSHNWSGPTSYINLQNTLIQTAADSSGWTLTDWNELPANGIAISGHHNRMEGCHLKNINFGISVTGNFNDIIGNTVENFAGDGLRGLGSDLLFQGNVVKNCYDVNENHDDGFQSWAVDGVPPRRVILRGNVFINYESPDQPFLGNLQGIGCFDGFYEDWLVENNLVIVDHWHGITFLGGRNVQIINNTVVNRDARSELTPWIRIGPHKDGRSSQDCVIRNNIAVNSFIADNDTISEGNLLVGDDDLPLWFVDFENLDYHLVASPPVDAGISTDAPAQDLDGNPRPAGQAVDVGCYEYTP
ncbi:hypothetical protein KKF84_09070 [Myxococcota bacterium]|nr:hypothetical protein [Myxococcota bacterium]MBU1535461.1 hypothetical protein [Myxococcota bacterium]